MNVTKLVELLGLTENITPALLHKFTKLKYFLSKSRV